MPENSIVTEPLTRAEQLLAGAQFQHRIDVDLSQVLEYAEQIKVEGTSDQRFYSTYLEARVAGMGGSYSQASALAEEVISHLDTRRADTLRALKSFWEIMQYTQGDGLMHYDEDLQIVLPGGPLLKRVDTEIMEAYRLKERTDALLNLATMSATLAIATEEMPYFEPVFHQLLGQLSRGFCDSDEMCAESALLGIMLVARYRGSDTGYDLSVALAEAYENADAWPLAALAWIRAGDIALDSLSSPFDLGLRPLNTMTSTMAMNTGQPIVEFQRASTQQLELARGAYDKAQRSQTKEHSARVAAHLIYRDGLLAWREGNHLAALPEMRRAVKKFISAEEHRFAYQASVSASISAALVGAEYDQLDMGQIADYGVRLGAVRLLSKASAYALHEMSNVNASFRLREQAIALARELEATQILSAQLTDQASFVTSLGQQRIGFILLQEAIGLHDAYLQAIPSIALHADQQRRADATQSTNLVIYAQTLDLVKTALSLEDLNLARAYNARLRAMEANGVLTMMGPIADANQVLIEIHDGDFERALALSKQQNDDIQIALALIFLERNAEAVVILEQAINQALDVLRPLVGTTTPSGSLQYQREISRLEQGLSILVRTGEYKLLQKYTRLAESIIGEDQLFNDSAKPYERDHFLAQLAAGLEQHDKARNYYRVSMRKVRERAEQVGTSHSAVRFDAEVAYLVNDYIQFLLLESDVHEGLRELERFRARDFQQVLISSAQLTGAARSLLSQWQQSEAALQIYLRKAASGDVPSNSHQLADLRSSVNDARIDLLQALGTARYEELNLDDVFASLDREDVTLLVYHLYGEKSSVSVLRSGKESVTRPISIPGYELRRHISRMEADMINADLAWRAPSRKLYVELLEPIEDLLPPKNGNDKPLLGVIAFGDTHRVPFEALVKDGLPLVERFDLFYQPSLLSFVRNTHTQLESLNNNVKAIGFNGDRLLYAEDEAQALDSRAYVGPQATGEVFLELMDSTDIVHVAVHAEPGIDNPYFSLLHFADGNLYLHELRGRDMAAPLVVLSACDTAAAERSRSDQAIAFATTFIENGVSATIVTRWAIDDELTVPLIEEFYTQLSRGNQPARALGIAQRGAIASGGDRAHPSFWAAFQLVGVP